MPLVLAYLALHRHRAVSREELVGALWPTELPVSHDAALRTLLSRLRSALGPDSVQGREELVLALPGPIWVDYEAALTALDRARSALEDGDGRGAWALAQIPFNIASRGLLPGRSAEWLEPFRRELDLARLDSLEVIGRAGLELGPSQIASVERAGRGLIEAERFRETGYVLLMEALAAKGETAEALRVFDDLRKLLRDELATPPSAEAIAVHQRLLHGGLGAAAGRMQTTASHGAAADGRGAFEASKGGAAASEHASRVQWAAAQAAARVPLPGELAVRAGAPLVGRRRELEQLHRYWEAARSGGAASELGTARTGVGPRGFDAARIVLLAGEPGVGKTRLLARLAERAHADGAVVLAGRSPQDTIVPYQPFLEALRHYVISTPATILSGVVREYAGDLSRLMPELRRRVANIPQPATADPDTARYRLFEAVVGLLVEISALAPVLLVLDDLHWADRSTLQLLRHLARAARPDRLLVIGAHRDNERGPGTEEARGELDSLRREPVVAKLAVDGLTERETAEFVKEIGEAPSRAFVTALHRQSEGNPLFVEEIVRALREAGVDPAQATAWDLARADVPEGVRQVISGRLERLDPGSYELLRLAAVLGRDFEAKLLEQLCGMREDEFLIALEQAIDASLLGDLQDGRLSFSHALVRDTLYEAMSSTRRARLHRRVAEALERRPGTAPSMLALHFARSAEEQSAGKAIAHARSAAAQAESMVAHEEAAEYLALALDVAERFAPGDRAQRLELLLSLAEAHVRSGDRKLAWPAFRRAAMLAEEQDDAESLARAAIGASRRYLQQPGVNDEELTAMLERALELVGPQPTVLRSKLLGRLCGAIYYAPQRARMKELAAEAMAIATALGDTGSKAYAFAARRRALWEPGELSERLNASMQMMSLARQAGETEIELQAHAWLLVDLLEQGQIGAVRAQMVDFAAGAEKLREPLYAWNLLVWKAMFALLEGHFDEAEAFAAEALAAGTPAEAVTAPQYHAIMLLHLRREQGRFAEFEPAARALAESNPDRPGWRAALAALLSETGRQDEARDHFELLAAGDFSDVPEDLDWLTTITLLADVCVALGDSRRAARLYVMLAPYANSNIVAGLGAICLGSASRFLGRLARTKGDTAAARTHLEQALAANATLGAVVALAHTRIDLAEVLELEAGTRSTGPEARRARALREQAREAADALDLGFVRARLQADPDLVPAAR